MYQEQLDESDESDDQAGTRISSLVSENAVPADAMLTAIASEIGIISLCNIMIHHPCRRLHYDLHIL